MEIIVDDREKHIIPLMQTYSDEFNITFEIKRLEVGDYAIAYKGVILLIIERKTWIDLSASMRDGRKQNISKLLSLKELTNCKVMYLIEGDPCPPRKKLFSAIPYKNLRSHLDHLMFRDDVHIQHTEDKEQTARRLFELANNYFTIKPSILPEVKQKDSSNVEEQPKIKLPKKKGQVQAEQKKKDEEKDVEEQDVEEQDVEEQDVERKDVEEQDEVEKNLDKVAKKVPRFGNKNLLTQRQKHELLSKANCEQLLQCLPSVGSVVSATLVEEEVSLMSLYDGTHEKEQIACIKYSSGAMIGNTKADKIMKCIKILKGSSALAQKIQIRILTCVPLISKETAKNILNQVGFSTLMEEDEEELLSTLPQIQKTEKTLLGQKASENILQLLRYKL